MKMGPLFRILSYSLRALATRWKAGGSSTHTGGYKPRRPSVVFLALLLAACHTPAVQTRTVEVKVPVAIQPIKPDQVPQAPAPLAKRPASPAAALDMLFSDHCKWVAYGLLADPLLRVSAGAPPKALPAYPECEK